MNTFRRFSKYVSLNVAGMIGISLYILADTFFVSGALGADGLAALNLAIPAYSLINALGLMLGVGCGTMYATCKSDRRRANGLFSGVVIVGLLAGVVIMLAGIFFAYQVAGLLGADGDTIGYSSVYLQTIMCFAPFFILNNILIAMVRNDGSPSLSMAAMITGSLANILLDYVFMFPLDMGMFGAAFATGLAPVISIALLSFHFIKRKNNFGFSFKRIRFKSAFKSLPSGLSSLITEMSSGVVLVVFNYRILGIAGNIGVAAYGIIANISLVCISVFTGIAQGIQPLISESGASGDRAASGKVIKYAVILSVVLGALFYAVGNIFSDGIISIFNSEGNPGLISIAKNGMLIYFAGFLFAGINIVYSAYLSALNKPKPAFVISLTRGCAAIIPLAFLLPYLLGINGVWLAFVSAEVVAFLIVIISALFKRKTRIR